MDIIDANAEDVRFLQATRHGEVMTPSNSSRGTPTSSMAGPQQVMERLRMGESLGIALIRADVPHVTRRLLLGHFVSDELADGLDNHYVLDNAGQDEAAFRAQLAVDEVLATWPRSGAGRRRSGRSRCCPLPRMLVLHGIYHQVPLFLASFAAFLAALPAIVRISRMRGLALREARLRSTRSTTFSSRCFCRSRF